MFFPSADAGGAKRGGSNRETGEERRRGEAVILPVFGAIDKKIKKFKFFEKKACQMKKYVIY